MTATRSGSQYVPGQDTRPLLATQLSDVEKRVIGGVERRLIEIHDTAAPNKRGSETRVEYFARADKRDRRILLLDGGRGTGKTSMLVTLVHRWHPPACDDYDDILGVAPDFVRALSILDFDPLPPGMPLPAWLVQAWRPLVDHLDNVVRNAGGNDDDGPLLDAWHKLFRLAAIGWSSIPRNAGLLDQVLDREEQVEGWHHLHYQWYEFVDSVLSFHEDKLPKYGKLLPPKPVFVIMIDDVDLQVERAAELLPTLRLLHHPSVVFVVAADRGHLMDMLRLDFLGRQRKLGSYPSSEEGGLWGAIDHDRWAETLASAAFEKVFASRDQWTLKWLSVVTFMDFPGPYSFRDVLNERGKPVNAPKGEFDPHADEKLGDYISAWGAVLHLLHIETAVMTYRAAQQLADEVFTTNDADARATLLLLRLLNAGGRHDAAVQLRGAGDPPIVEYRRIGEASAVFSPDVVVPVLPARQKIFLSGTPRFSFLPDDEDPWRQVASSELPLMELLAVSLQDTGRRVSAPGIRWEPRVTLAWTQLQVDDVPPATFRWLLHIVPAPLVVLEWAQEWTAFIGDLAEESYQKRDRIAYGWIYHQLRWLGANVKDVPAPKEARLEDDKTWAQLVAVVPPEDDPRYGLGSNRWLRRTLPLLARPELGLTPDVQLRLLRKRSPDTSIADLVKERKRLIRDAFDAAAVQRGTGTARIADEDAAVDRILKAIKMYHPDSPWYTEIEPAESPSGS